jgi:3'-phosphoadenosine 5'-phosphosulfate sulfotransferase (PAPS reductase)/FAD synthetase
MPTLDELKLLQALPLELKIAKTKARIKEWVDFHGVDSVYVSFSGGKDSTVLLHISRSMYPNIKAVFSDTGLELPSIRSFVKTHKNVDWLKPKLTFGEIVKQYGYPLFGKEISHAIWYARKIKSTDKDNTVQRANRLKLTGQLTRNCEKTIQHFRERSFSDKQQADKKLSIFNKEKYLPACQTLPFLIGDVCCSIMKKRPFHAYEKENHKVPMIATLAEESMMRTQSWLRNGCNAFESKDPKSQPLSFWLEQDILQYIKDNNITIADIYGDIIYKDKNGNAYDNTLCRHCGKLACSGVARTGCAFCGFGAGNEHKTLGKSRYELLAEKYPKIYDFVLRGGEWVENPYYEPCAPEYDPVDGWRNWNPKKIWQPTANGLGMKFVFDEVNAIYGKDYIKYQ